MMAIDIPTAANISLEPRCPPPKIPPCPIMAHAVNPAALLLIWAVNAASPGVRLRRRSLKNPAACPSRKSSGLKRIWKSCKDDVWRARLLGNRARRSRTALRWSPETERTEAFASLRHTKYLRVARKKWYSLPGLNLQAVYSSPRPQLHLHGPFASNAELIIVTVDSLFLSCASVGIAVLSACWGETDCLEVGRLNIHDGKSQSQTQLEICLFFVISGTITVGARVLAAHTGRRRPGSALSYSEHKALTSVSEIIRPNSWACIWGCM